MRERGESGGGARLAALLERIHRRDVSRRGAIKAIAGGGLTLGAGKAVDNVFVGYGVLTGTNLVEQDLASLAAEDFGPDEGRTIGAEGHTATVSGDQVEVTRGEDTVATRPLASLGPETGEELDLPEPLAGALSDLGAVARGDVTFEFYRTEPFFERIAEAEARPLSVEALRHWHGADSELVAEFADADPAEPRALLSGLVDGFREHAYYDAPRYVAGSIQDNILLGAVDLRAPLREPVDFASIVDGPDTGMFCYEFTYRSVEALHAVPAPKQTAPVLGGRVIDSRHKHVYTAVGSLIRDDGALRVPVTFVDYTHTTLYDDLRARGILGEGFEAYGRRHRASVIDWNPYE